MEFTTTPPDAAAAMVPPESWTRDAPSVGEFEDLAQAAKAAGAREVTVAAHPTNPAIEAAARGAGFGVSRHMLQLRRSLPVGSGGGDDPRNEMPAPVGTVRAFDPATDRQRWLEVNRRAFAWHPEQGLWTAEDLDARLAEPWFDPEGFLVHDGGAGIDAFCWTKVHPPTDADPALGEIYVIGVDPDAHGRGLGRHMVMAGLDHLHGQGLDTAMLYVESDNAAGRALYDALGFHTHQDHHWYTRSLGDDGTATPVSDHRGGQTPPTS